MSLAQDTNMLKIAEYEHEGLKPEVSLTTFSMGKDIHKLVIVETMGKTYELELANGFGKLDEFLKSLRNVIKVHDLAGGPEDVIDYMDGFIIGYDEYIDEAVPIYMI